MIRRHPRSPLFPDPPLFRAARLWELAACRFIEEQAAILLCGPTGVGKTFVAQGLGLEACRQQRSVLFTDRKSTRLNSSHANISYAVFCLKTKKNISQSITLD